MRVFEGLSIRLGGKRRLSEGRRQSGYEPSNSSTAVVEGAHVAVSHAIASRASAHPWSGTSMAFPKPINGSPVPVVTTGRPDYCFLRTHRRRQFLSRAADGLIGAWEKLASRPAAKVTPAICANRTRFTLEPADPKNG